MQCPGSVMEGGLVAQQVGVKSSAKPSGCPQRDAAHGCTAPTDTNGITTSQYYQCIITSSASNDNTYCEYRDDAGSSSATLENRVKGVRISITPSSTGTYSFGVESNSLKMGHNSSNPSTSQTYNRDLVQGETYSEEFEIWASPNYEKEGNRNVAILVLPVGWSSFGDSIDSCDVTIIDDDNTAYVGRRNHHPYGGNWQTTPCCWDHNCAYNATRSNSGCSRN